MKAPQTCLDLSGNKPSPSSVSVVSHHLNWDLGGGGAKPSSCGVGSFPGDSDVQPSWEALPCVSVTRGTPEKRWLLTGTHLTRKGTPGANVHMAPGESKNVLVWACLGV